MPSCADLNFVFIVMTKHDCDSLQNIMHYRLKHKSRIYVHHMVSSIKKSHHLNAFAVQRNLVLWSERGADPLITFKKT